MLERLGAARRWRVLGGSDLERAAALYASGLSCAAVAQILGVHTNTIHRALTKSGVEMRDPHERPKERH